MSVPLPPKAVEAINKIKAQYDEKLAALSRYEKESLQLLRQENGELLRENLQLRNNKRQAARAIQQKDRQIMALTATGVPALDEPCALCGRVTELFVERVDERLAEREDDSNERPATAEDEKSKDTPDLLTANEDTGKHLLDTVDTHHSEKTEAPEHSTNKVSRLIAAYRIRRDAVRAKDEPFLDQEFETEDSIFKNAEHKNIMTGMMKPKEKVVTPYTVFDKYSSMDDEDLEIDADSVEIAGGDWTEEELAVANSTATSISAWSAIPEAWKVEFASELENREDNGRTAHEEFREDVQEAATLEQDQLEGKADNNNEDEDGSGTRDRRKRKISQFGSKYSESRERDHAEEDGATLYNIE
jgi:hypothetical protein